MLRYLEYMLEFFLIVVVEFWSINTDIKNVIHPGLEHISLQLNGLLCIFGSKYKRHIENKINQGGFISKSEI